MGKHNKAIALKDISPLIKKGAVIIKRGKYGIIEGYEKREKVECMENGIVYQTPNFYPWEQIKLLKNWWRLING